MARPRSTAKRKRPIATATVRVEAPPHLCRVQRTTRELCRSAGFSESAVFQSVIAVTDFAYRLHLERPRSVDIALSALRHRDGLELRAESAGPGDPSPDRVSLPFPP